MSNIIVTIIGGGSVNWMPKLMKGFFKIDELNGGEIRLVDPPNKGNAELIAKMIDTFNKIRKKEFKVFVVNDRKEGLNNADFVWTTYSPGTLKAFWNDLEIPKKYGIDMPVGAVTVGPGGISAGLRSIPVAFEIIKDMEEACPNAWMLNETNPMYGVTKAMNLASSTIKVIGMCHEFHNRFPEFIEKIFNLKKPEGMKSVEYSHHWLPKNGFEYIVTGLNHFIFLIKAKLNGKDVLPIIRNYCKENWKLEHKGLIDINSQKLSYSDSNPFDNRGASAALAIGRQLGYLSICGDRETIEHIPSLCNYRNGWGMKYGVLKTEINYRKMQKRSNLDKIKIMIENNTHIDFDAIEEEQMIDIIKAIVGKKKTKCMINTPNNGRISNLPEEVIVEAESEVSINGIAATYKCELPRSIGTLCRLHSDVKELATKAALEGSRDLFIEALSIDPMASCMDFNEIGSMADELLYANKAWLPRFFS